MFLIWAVPSTPSASLDTELSSHAANLCLASPVGIRAPRTSPAQRSPAPPALRRQTSRQDVPTGRLSRRSPGPCQGPGAKSAGSSAPPGSFPRDLHPASPPARGEGGWAGAAQLWLAWRGRGVGRVEESAFSARCHSCGMEAALSPRTGVWLCCCCFLKRRKGRDEFPDAKNGEECEPLLG